MRGILSVFNMELPDNEYLLSISNEYGTFEFRVPSEFLSALPQEISFFTDPEWGEEGIHLFYFDGFGIRVWVEDISQISFFELDFSELVNVLAVLSPHVLKIETTAVKAQEWIKEKKKQEEQEELPF